MYHFSLIPYEEPLPNTIVKENGVRVIGGISNNKRFLALIVYFLLKEKGTKVRRGIPITVALGMCH
jgi:hypothetical protein